MSIQGIVKKTSSGFRRAGLVLALSALVMVPTAGATTLAQAIAQALAALQAAGQQTQAAIQKIQQQTQAALGQILGQSGGALGAALQQTIASFTLILKESNPGYLDPTPGTTSFTETLTFQGATRTYLVIRPEPATQDAPALILMHAAGITPQTMANLARVGRLSRDYGVWVFLPQGKNGTWNQNPSAGSTVDDVGFISAMIDKVAGEYGLDKKRIYAEGYSAGGFMAERLACQLSSKIAGFAAVAATLRDSMDNAALCTPTHDMPAAFVDGTSDLIVPYNGEPTVQSAAAATAFWAVKNGCVAMQMKTTTLPQQVKDGTTVALTEFTQCPATAAVSLYTINGGGHTWPGSPDSLYTSYLGLTSKNLDATVELWKFLTPYSPQ